MKELIQIDDVHRINVLVIQFMSGNLAFNGFLVFHHESRGREASREIGYEQCANLRYETSVFDIISGSSIDSLLGPETLIGRQHQSFLVDTTSVQ
jgi:hypothetical protein